MDTPAMIALDRLTLVDIRRIYNQRVCPCCRHEKRTVALMCQACEAALPQWVQWTFHMPPDVLRQKFVTSAGILGCQMVWVHPYPGAGERQAEEEEAELQEACAEYARMREAGNPAALIWPPAASFWAGLARRRR